MAAELEIKLAPDTVKMFEEETLSHEAAVRLTKIALMVSNYESAKYDTARQDPEVMRQWLSEVKRKTQLVIERFSINVTIEAITRNGATEFSFKFHKNDISRVL
jgi:hypothetical protein